MRKTYKKVFFVWQSKKEQLWLENMAKQGYILVSIKPFRYVFEIAEPLDVVYQFDFQILNKESKMEYLELLKNWHFVDNYGSWYYFYKIRENNENDEIYNNVQSKKDMIRRILGFMVIIGFPLYYQTLIMFPNMDQSKFEFPSFYFFFRIIVIIFLAIYIYASVNILLIYRSLNKSIKQ